MKNTAFLSIHFSLSLKETYLFYEGDWGRREKLIRNGNNRCFDNSSIRAQILIVLPRRCPMQYCQVYFFILKYLCVCVCTLCVAGAPLCKVRDRMMVGEGQSYAASCVSFHKTQTTYEKSIRGPRLTIMQMRVNMFYYPDISSHQYKQPIFTIQNPQKYQQTIFASLRCLEDHRWICCGACVCTLMRLPHLLGWKGNYSM